MPVDPAPAATPSADAPEAERAAADPPVYTVSVRSLCDFSARVGDLDRRFTPSASALEGQIAPQWVAARRGPDYQREWPLVAWHGRLRVRGRADGFDPARQRLEEFKTTRSDPQQLPADRRRLHWAQLETYGAMHCRQHRVDALWLALVYVDPDSGAETELLELRTAEQLDTLFRERCERFAGWAAQELAHRQARDSALSALPFPPGSFRPGQRDLAEAVYRAALAARCLLAQAPTGIGKTLGTLFPLLRAMPNRRLDKIAFLTCKTTGRSAALHALTQLRDAMPRPALRVMVLVAREQGCEHPQRACHGDSCPLARGFYDRLPAARAEAIATGWWDAPTQRALALRHGLCPFYFGHELQRWADVWVGDVHHAFDPHGLLFSLTQALRWRVALLVDEAHNLVDRARRMYSAELRLDQLQAAQALAPAGLRGAFSRLIGELQTLAETPGYQVLEPPPADLLPALQTLGAALGDHLLAHPLATGGLLDCHHTLLAMQRALAQLDAQMVLDGAPDPATGSWVLSVRNVVPAPFLKPRFQAFHSATLFSATLAPQRYQRDLLGLPADTGWIDVPPAFPPEHLVVQVAGRLSTRLVHRSASLNALVDLMAGQFSRHPGNYLAFFSSFDYLDQAADRLARRHPELPQWRQAAAMSAGQRQQFLDRFSEQGRGIGFAVLGGAFAEGVDLPGTRLIGAFIATLALPPVTPVWAQMRLRLDRCFGPGHGYADQVPGLQKVIQAAGRVLRTPTDRGWLWLIDRRYLHPEVQALLPASWGLSPAGVSASAGARPSDG